MQRWDCATELPDLAVAPLIGAKLGADSFTQVFQDDVDVYRPDGRLLLAFRKRALPPDLCTTAFALLRRVQARPGGIPGLRSRPDNRFIAAAGHATPTAVTQDGYRSNTFRVPPSAAPDILTASSAIVGYYDRTARFPYCRQTAFLMHHLARWQRLLPFFQAVGCAFADTVPDRYAAQQAVYKRIHPDFRIPDCPFTTVTVNKSWQCVDAETECLTRRLGWTRQAALQDDDEILTYDPATNMTAWAPLRGVYRAPFNGDLMALRGQGFNALTTEDHRWPCRGRAERHREFLSATLPTSHYWSLLRGAPHSPSAPEVYPDALVRLAAWHMTEGSLSPDGLRVSISQSARINPSNVESIRDDLLAAGARPESEWAPPSCSSQGCQRRASARGLCNMHFHRFRYAARRRHGWSSDYRRGRRGTRRRGLWFREHHQRNDMVTFVLKGAGLAPLLSLVRGTEKIPDMGFIAALDPRQARIFVDTCLAGDGHERRRRFFQKHPERMAAFTAAAVLAGLYPVEYPIRRSGFGSDILSCAVGRLNPRINARNVTRLMVPYQGTIWCPSVPTGYWVARRAGTVYITGNTRVHVDAGDLPEGFGVMCALRWGTFTGGYLCFPRYGIAVDMDTTDLLFADVHEYHGNTPMVGKPGRWERVSCVFYVRSFMVECGSAAEEVARVKSRKRGDSIHA